MYSKKLIGSNLIMESEIDTHLLLLITKELIFQNLYLINHMRNCTPYLQLISFL